MSNPSVYVRCRIPECGPFEVVGSLLNDTGFWDLDCPAGHCNSIKADTASPSLRELFWSHFERTYEGCDYEARELIRDYVRRNFSLTV